MAAGTVFRPCLEGMNHVKSREGKMLTKPFLDVCKLILPVIDKFGAAMTLVKSDIGDNISMLVSLFELGRNQQQEMKGMLKGLRYIFQIFGSSQNNNKKGDSEFIIGEPTDVKHVAHIGNDGPSANTPSWMNEYNPATEASRNRGANPSSGVSSETHAKPKHKARRKASNNSGSPCSSRHRSSNDSIESPSRDPPPHRKNRSANDGVDGAAQPRHRQKKSTSKGSSRPKGNSSSSADV